MGHEIERIALERGHQIMAICNDENDWFKLENDNTISNCDVIVDFTTPDSAPSVIKRAFNYNIPIVSGTTGLNELIPELKDLAVNQRKTFFYSSNFSIGVNIFFRINNQLAKLLSPIPDYKVDIHEIHHIHKKDAPSGTAITLADGIITNHSRYRSWSMANKAEDDAIKVKSERVGEVTGTHIINWSSEIDSIQLLHSAHNRKGFALGAIIACEWVKDKVGYYSMNDLLD